jgi:hypothetical protein
MLRLVRRLALVLVATAAAAAALLIVVRLQAGTPQGTRTWAADHAIAPRVEFRGDSAIIYGFRRFRHDSSGRYTARWDTTAIDLSRVDKVWFALAPFGAPWMQAAHSFVTFGTTDSQYVSISVEARREQGETFTLANGLTRRLELLYVIGDENDVLRQRVIAGHYDLYLYPMVSPVHRTRELLTHMLTRADALRSSPEFYDIVTNNCTSNLIAHVNTLIPGRIPRRLGTLLPGYADRVAASIGLIDAAGDPAALRARFHVNDLVRALPDDAGFARALHSALAQRARDAQRP